MSNENIEKLPRFEADEITFLSSDGEKIRDKLIAEYESQINRKLQKSDIIYLLFSVLAANEVQIRSDIDNACKQNLLTYAQNEYLDAIGQLVSCKRIESSKAKTKLKFTLSLPSKDVFIIPKGTKVSNGRVIFATDKAVQILKGQDSVEVTASAINAGSFANNIEIGSINRMVDPLPNVASVMNLEVTTGGGDKEPDEAYAKRIQIAPDAFSVAGPIGAYVYHCLSYSSSLIDVSVYGLEDRPGYVFIHPLLKDGVIPEKSFLDGLNSYLNQDTIRPLTDLVDITAPKSIDYQIKFKWYLNTKDIDRQRQITEKISQVTEEYRLWQQSKIGLNINPDELIKRLREAGAERLEIESPVFNKIAKDEVAQCTKEDISIEFAGIED